MVTAESMRGRRIVGALKRGTDLIAELRVACASFNVRCGEVRAIGILEQAELCAYDQQRRRAMSPRVLEGNLELLALSGNISEQAGSISIVARATLMRDRDAGMEVLGGQLLSGRVFAVEFVIESFDDVMLRRSHDASLGIAVWSEALVEQVRTPLPDNPEPTIDHVDPVAVAHHHAPPAAVTPVATPEPTQISPPPVAASEPDDLPVVVPVEQTPRRKRESGYPAEDVDLAAGDVIVHPKFRRCVVQRIEGDNEFVQVRLRNGRVVRLSLDIIELRPQGTENGQRIFEARIS